MTSKTFNLTDGSESSKSWAKRLIGLCCVLVVIVIVVVSIYAYKSGGFGGYGSCDIPKLDENGLSNWTTGAETIAFACFPGYFLEGQSSILPSNCVNGTWNPPPPACNFLPLRLDCQIRYRGLEGNISMWQKTDSEPAFIYGVLDYEDADRSDGHLLDVVQISKAGCYMSDDIANVTEMYEEAGHQSLIIEFNSTQLKAYNKAEVHVNLIFVDTNTTASLISIHQEEKTFVLPNSLSLQRVPRDMLLKYGWNDFAKLTF